MGGKVQVAADVVQAAIERGTPFPSVHSTPDKAEKPKKKEKQQAKEQQQEEPRGNEQTA